MRNNQIITKQHIQNAYTYESYRKLIDELLLEGKTTGNNQSKEYLDYTRLNVHRMNRWDKITVIESEVEKKLKKISKKFYLVVLTEAWCGDSANFVPIIEKLRQQNPEFLSLHLLLRDENPEIMEDNLTDGKRSIPKLIILDKNLEKLATWGPRPQPLVLQIQAWRSQGLEYSQVEDKIQVWYSKDKSLTIQKEIADILVSLS